jgi:hypothetical protein
MAREIIRAISGFCHREHRWHGGKKPIIISAASLFSVAALFSTFGCGLTGEKRPYLQDPLLISKKPVEGRAQDARPMLLAQRDPLPPMSPGVTLAAAPRPIANGDSAPMTAQTPTENPAGAAAGTVSTYKGAVEVTPAVRVKEGQGAVPAVTAVQRQVPGIYGNAPDYGWLQGVVDKHYQGQWYLRYCDSSVEDKYGGKVCLLNDPRLGQLKDGDVIFVEGELALEKETASRGPWHRYPGYQIRTLRPVQSQQ